MFLKGNEKNMITGKQISKDVVKSSPFLYFNLTN